MNPLSRPETHRFGGRRCRCQYFTKRAWLSSSMASRMGMEPPMPTAQHALSPPPRRFLCALCRCAVLICSHCDRGQRYCSAVCSHQARSCAQRAAGKRYQDSRKGRHAHAQRQGRWRTRRQIVTHQGSPPPCGAGVLPPGDETALNPDTSRPCKCHFCGRSVSDFVRLDFLRCRPLARADRIHPQHLQRGRDQVRWPGLRCRPGLGDCPGLERAATDLHPAAQSNHLAALHPPPTGTASTSNSTARA